MESLLILTLFTSMAGNWVNVSPMRKCLGDKLVGLEGSSETAHKGLEFRQASIFGNIMQISKSVAIREPSVFRRWYFIDLTGASYNTPKCEACGGLKFHSHPSFVRKSWMYATCDDGWSIL